MNRSMRMIGGPLLLVLALIVARILIPNKMNFITEISVFSIYVMGCNVLYGYLGMVSFGQPFYLGIGAYSAAIYLAYIGTSPLISILMGILVGFIIGGVLGPFFVRLRGDYFALVNAAICAIGLFIFEKLLIPITRGDDGLWYRARMTATPLLDLRQPAHFFFFVMITLAIVLILFRYIDQSVLGISFRAVKVNERKMRFLGYSAFKIKWIGFTLASMLSGLAGALYAVNFGFVNPNLGTPHRAAEVLVATLIGGAGTVYGPFFGSLAFIGIRDVVSKYIARWEFFVGVLTLIVLFKFAKGIWGNIDSLLRERFGGKREIIRYGNVSCPVEPHGKTRAT
ncbi:MAG TPA: branched-chain amino acid ABC transporter permease [Thermodesulfobacteriota bacterium]|nr:branched-chain amino acid ABC transporter permease [Thermodesulfobacteriota bacterium]